MRERVVVRRPEFLVLFIALFSACSPASDAGMAGAISTRPYTGDNGGSANPVGDSCVSDDPNKLCLSLKYVAYKDSADEAVVSQAHAISNVSAINGVFEQCNLAFQIESYLPIVPADAGLKYRTANYSELDEIRTEFRDDSALLVVTTGTWDRTGTLGNSGANAWTTLPGTGPFGAVLERTVGTYPNIIAHELGHYLNLLHVSDTRALMNPVIYTSSTTLYSSQCNTARATAKRFWSRMLR